MIERKDYVQVTSTREKIVGRYDGEDFEFLPGVPNSIPKLAAAHIFGFNKPDKTPALARLGWATSSDHNAQALDRLRAVRFAEAPPLVEFEEPEEEPAEASAGERMPDRTSGSRPIAPGGNSAPATQGAGAVEPQGKKPGK